MHITGRLAWLSAHLVLLVVASTGYTIATGLGDGQFQWEYFRYLSQTGSGASHPLPYSLPVVLAYLAAYATGLVAYRMAWGHASLWIVAAGLVLCGMGTLSFAIEPNHWLGNRGGSWIASAPVAGIVLGLAAAIQQYRRHAAEVRA